MAASSPTVLVPANMDPARFQVPQTTTTSLNYNTSTMMSSNVANSLAVSIASSSQQNGIVAASHPGYSVVPGSSGEGVGNVMMSPSHHHSQVKRNMHSSIILKTIRNTKKFVPRRFGEIMAFFK